MCELRPHTAHWVSAELYILSACRPPAACILHHRLMHRGRQCFMPSCRQLNSAETAALASMQRVQWPVSTIDHHSLHSRLEGVIPAGRLSGRLVLSLSRWSTSELTRSAMLQAAEHGSARAGSLAYQLNRLCRQCASVWCQSALADVDDLDMHLSHLCLTSEILSNAGQRTSSRTC